VEKVSVVSGHNRKFDEAKFTVLTNFSLSSIPWDVE
jgi:hypothetical protein